MVFMAVDLPLGVIFSSDQEMPFFIYILIVSVRETQLLKYILQVGTMFAVVHNC